MKKESKGANIAAPQDGKEVSWDNKARGRELYEERYKCKLITYEELMKNSRNVDFGIKLKQLARYGNVDSVMLISELNDMDKNHLQVQFFTNDNIYSIHVLLRGVNKDSYMGCTVSSRKNRPGEIWNRVNDLPDGKYNDDTWQDILTAIIQYEMKTLQI